MFYKILLAGALCSLVGCGGGGQEFSSPSSKTARLTWIGYQSFLIQSSLGTKILTNPFAPGSVSRPMPTNLSPEILLITHEDRKANFARAIENFPIVLRSSVGMGTHNASGIRIRGTATFPNPSNPDIVEMNLVYTWSVDGMRFCFPGDLAAPLSAEVVSEIAPVDILFLPVGGKLNAAGRAGLLSQLRPKVIVPMGHAGAISSWAASYPRVHRVSGKSISLSTTALPSEPVAIVFASQ